MSHLRLHSHLIRAVIEGHRVIRRTVLTVVDIVLVSCRRRGRCVVDVIRAFMGNTVLILCSRCRVLPLLSTFAIAVLVYNHLVDVIELARGVNRVNWIDFLCLLLTLLYFLQMILRVVVIIILILHQRILLSGLLPLHYFTLIYYELLLML